MRRILSVGVAAMTAAVGILAAGESAARDRSYYGNRYYDRRHDDHDDAVAAGIVGLALGAALSSGSHHSRSYYSYEPRYGYGYGRGYYAAPGYGYGYGRGYYAAPRYGYYDRPYYRTCRTVRTYDPYYGPIRERRCW